jgi:hypothetical protein
VRGVVVDREGRAVAGARIRLVRGAQAVSVVSSARGGYAVRNVHGGPYHLLVSKAGFETGAVALTLGELEARTLDFRLLRKPRVVTPTRVTPAAAPPGSPGGVPGRPEPGAAAWWP